MNALGFKYLHGTGVPKDTKRAAYWFCEAVVRGNWRAMNNLGLLLISGEVPVDLPEARKSLDAGIRAWSPECRE